MIFVPLVFLLLSLSLLAVVIYQISAPMAKVVNGVNAYVAKSCVFTAEKFASLPGGHFQFAAENQPFLLVYDLGHGAGAACFSGGKSGAVLLDCGDRYSFKRQLAPSLRRLGISPDSVILSHPDGGHLGGGAAVWTIFPIRQVLLPVTRSRSPAYQAWVAEAPAAGIQMLQAAEFRELPLPDGARLEMIHTPDSHSQHAVADDRVAVFRLHWHGWKILFTSDAGILAETAMLDAHKDFSADVVIAGRHRSNTGMSDEFLAAANPQVIIASHSILPASERLRPETVSYWRSRGIQVIHQGESGGVMVKINQAGELQLEGFVNQSLISLKHKRTR